MKSVFAVLAMTLGLLIAALPASAGYVSPNAGWATQAFTNGIP